MPFWERLCPLMNFLGLRASSTVLRRKKDSKDLTQGSTRSSSEWMRKILASCYRPRRSAAHCQGSMRSHWGRSSNRGRRRQSSTLSPRRCQSRIGARKMSAFQNFRHLHQNLQSVTLTNSTTQAGRLGCLWAESLPNDFQGSTIDACRNRQSLGPKLPNLSCAATIPRRPTPNARASASAFASAESAIARRRIKLIQTGNGIKI